MVFYRLTCYPNVDDNYRTGYPRHDQLSWQGLRCTTLNNISTGMGFPGSDSMELDVIHGEIRTIRTRRWTVPILVWVLACERAATW